MFFVCKAQTSGRGGTLGYPVAASVLTPYAPTLTLSGVISASVLQPVMSIAPTSSRPIFSV
jgi:hypothetical protein